MTTPRVVRGQLMTAAVFNALADAVDSALAATDSDFSPLRYAATADGAADDRAALVAADTAALAAGQPVVIDAPFAVASNLTMASPLVFEGRGKLVPRAGVQITPSKGFSVPPLTQSFDFSALNGGFAIISLGATLTPEMFGALPDTSGVDAAPALNAWFTAVKKTRGRGEFRRAYRVASDLTWDYADASDKGIQIEGVCRDASGLRFDAGKALLITGGALFFHQWDGFSVNGSAEVVCRAGKDDLSDGFNSSFFGITVRNASASATAVAFRGNGIFRSTFDLTGNGSGSGNPFYSSAPGVGTAVEFRRVQYSDGAVASGNANTAMHLRDDYCFGLELSLDIEEADTGLKISSASVTDNQFTGVVLATKTFDATAGRGNVFRGITNLYSGGRLFNTNPVGLTIVQPQNGGVSTPTLPASGVTAVNNTGRHVMVYIGGGTLNALTVFPAYGGSAGLPNISSTGMHAVSLAPGAGLRPSYSGAAPGWVWLPDDRG